MAFKRSGSAQWKGGLKDGKGTVSTQSGALDALPYAFSNRFGDEKGTNPEELLGAAHSACFSMALSKILEEEGTKAEQLDTTAEVTLEQKDGAFVITYVHLTLKAKVPGTTPDTFKELANKAKAGCPVSKLFKAEITLDATLID